jgi:DNA-binding MarR family transcriptional regulator
MSNLERDILREIGAVTRCINSISDIKYKNINLQKGQFIFLIRVCENPGINQRDLSKLLKVDKTTTAKAIQKLINVGYIERKEDPSDKRIWRLYPLQKALDAYDYITKEENRVNKDYYNNFDKEEKKLVYNLLKKLRENIENDWNNN